MNNNYQLALWLAFVISSSIVEGMLFHNRKPTVTKIDIHYVLFAMRLFVFLLLSPDLRLLILCTFTFPFLHDGIYYEVRNILSKGVIYPQGFVDESHNTTAIFSFNFPLRLSLFVIGVIFYAIYNKI